MRATGIRTIDRPDAYEKNEWNGEERSTPQHREKEFIYRFDDSNHGVHGWLLSSNTFHGIAFLCFGIRAILTMVMLVIGWTARVRLTLYALQNNMINM